MITLKDKQDKIHLLCTFRRKLPSLSTLDERLPLTSGDAAFVAIAGLPVSWPIVYLNPVGTRNLSKMWVNWYCPLSLFIVLPLFFLISTTFLMHLLYLPSSVPAYYPGLKFPIGQRTGKTAVATNSSVARHQRQSLLELIKMVAFVEMYTISGISWISIKGVLHPKPILWLFVQFSQKSQHIGDK